MPDRVVALQLLSLYWLAVILPPVLCFSAIYNERTADLSNVSPYSHHHQGRKFGGYKILPKPCKDTTLPQKETGVCMFNYECTQKSGTVVGSCMDGFLYGTCCKLPPGVHLSTVTLPETTTIRQYSPPSDRSTTLLRPHIGHVPEETYLLYKNGTVVHNANSPDEFFLISKQQTPSVPQTSPLPAQGDGLPSPDTRPMSGEYFHSVEHTTKPYSSTSSSGEPFSPDFLSTKYAGYTTKTLSSTYRTTDYFNQSSKFNFATAITTTSMTPTSLPTKIKDENLIRIPTITADNLHNYSSNVSHILWVLNDTTTEAAIVDAPTQSTQAFYTWLSVQNNDVDKVPSYMSTKPLYQFPNSTPPATTLHHIPGPSFQVTPEVKITSKPLASVGDPTPTVILISSAQDTASTSPKRPPIVTLLSSAQSTIALTPSKRPNSGYTSTVSYNVSYHYSQISSSPSKPKPYTDTPSHNGILITAKPSPKPSHHSNYNSKPVQPNNGSFNAPVPVTSTTPNPVNVSLITKIKPPLSVANSATSSMIVQTTLMSTAKPMFPASVNSNVAFKPTYEQFPIPSHNDNFPTASWNYASVPPTIIHNSSPLPGFDSQSSFSVYPVASGINSSTESLFAFPPVRDPHPNFTGIHHVRPITLATTTFGEAEEWVAEEEASPQFLVDKTSVDKMQAFVQKIVQSLQGNFEDLEKVLITGESTDNVTVYTGPQKKPSTTVTKKPSKKPSSGKPATALLPQKITTTVLPTATLATKKPVTKRPTVATPAVLFQPSYNLQISGAGLNKRPPMKVTTTVSISAPSSSSASMSSAPSEETVGITTNEMESESQNIEPEYRKNCGIRPLARKAGKIVGGKGTTFGEWPWQVLVREATWLGLFTKNKCGGVLITDKYVITAAHCQPGFLANLVAVFGEFDISGEVETKRSVSKNIRRVIVHRQYDAATFENDIALLELESPVQFDSHIAPICMPADNEEFTGRMATVTGWGRLKYGGGVPSVLQEVQVPIIESKVCQEMFHTAGHPKVILPSFICAGYVNGQRDSCEGDSGGPLTVQRGDGRWTLVATVSHGIKCAAPYLPGVYMKTTYYKPWLQIITGV